MHGGVEGNTPNPSKRWAEVDTPRARGSNTDDINQADRPTASIIEGLIAGNVNVRDLRRRWKPLKEGEAAAEEHEPVRIRLHRAFSWMQRVHDLTEATADADDARLVYYWIAFNALYGRWDAEKREPLPDRGGLRVFTKSLCEHDHNGLVPAMKYIDTYALPGDLTLDNVVDAENLMYLFEQWGDCQSCPPR